MRRNLNGITANWTHSWDGCVNRSSIRTAHHNGVTEVGSVHDSLSTPAPHCGIMAASIREAAIEIFSDDPLERFRQGQQAMLPQGIHLPEPPNGGISISMSFEMPLLFQLNPKEDSTWTVFASFHRLVLRFIRGSMTPTLGLNLKVSTPARFASLLRMLNRLSRNLKASTSKRMPITAKTKEEANKTADLPVKPVIDDDTGEETGDVEVKFKLPAKVTTKTGKS